MAASGKYKHQFRSLLLSSVLALCFLTFAAMAAPFKAGFDQCGPSHAFAPNGSDARFARGFNLPNWDPGYEGYKPDDGLLRQLREMGFSHIRLPVSLESLVGRYSSKDGIEAQLSALGQMITRLVALDFAVSVDLLPDQPFQITHKNRPDLGLAYLVEAWDKIAAISEGWPQESVYFELLNEPIPDQDVWWPQAQTLVHHLNRIAKGRKLIIGPAVFQRHEVLIASEPLNGENLVYAIHYYDPFLFTHQAMTWEEGSAIRFLRQLPFPADAQSPAVVAQIENMKARGAPDLVRALQETFQQPWNAARIATDFAALGQWSKHHKVPVIVNEFGVLDFDVDRRSRINWLRAVRLAAEKNCIGWAHWDFSDGFAMVNPQTTLPDPFVMDALLSNREK
ncbi:cellulase family glycosylhydrolase [uncultured Cohaesibacter sp.]|uniref:glycoside hydrolase family 5 protein n=1 Tax=uncultured Cohaesibacter sp. TaxID=1002546 RepID=UPI00292DFF3E|nr:cellulase family glycosylhydrolase [uncultured Cohaesibacter sp.]